MGLSPPLLHSEAPWADSLTSLNMLSRGVMSTKYNQECNEHWCRIRFFFFMKSVTDLIITPPQPTQMMSHLCVRCSLSDRFLLLLTVSKTTPAPCSRRSTSRTPSSLCEAAHGLVGYLFEYLLPTQLTLPPICSQFSVCLPY